MESLACRRLSQALVERDDRDRFWVVFGHAQRGGQLESIDCAEWVETDLDLGRPPDGDAPVATKRGANRCI